MIQTKGAAACYHAALTELAEAVADARTLAAALSHFEAQLAGAPPDHRRLPQRPPRREGRWMELARGLAREVAVVGDANDPLLYLERRK
jgi:hypothetical protein